MRRHDTKLSLRVMALLVSTILTAACAPTFKFEAHPQLQEKLLSIKTVALKPPRVDVYQDSMTGREIMADWSAAAQENIVQAVEAELSRDARFIITPLPSQGDVQLVIAGSDTVLSPGSKVFTMSLVPLLIPYCILAGAGCGGVASDPSWFKVKLVETATDTVLWSYWLDSLRGYDLRDRGSTTALIQKVFKDFPRAGGAQ